MKNKPRLYIVEPTAQMSHGKPEHILTGMMVWVSFFTFATITSGALILMSLRK